MPLPIKVAFEGVATRGPSAIADRFPRIRFIADAGEVDVVHQLGVGGGIAVRIAVHVVNDVAEAFQLVGGADPVWGRFGAESWWQAILGIFLQHWAVQRLADAPDVGEIPALEFFRIGEIADGGCACVRVIITDARLSGVHRLCLQKIALVDGGAVIPYNAADGAINKTAEITGVVAICDAAVARIAPNDAAKGARSGGIITSDVAGAVGVCDAAVARVAPNDAAEIAANKRTSRKGIRVIEEIAGVVAAGNSSVGAAVLSHNAAKIAAAGVRASARSRNTEAAAVAAVFNSAAVIPHDAAEVVVAAADDETAGVGAVCDAAVVLPHDAADVATAAEAARGEGAVCDAATVLPHNAADIDGTPAVDAAGEGAVCDDAAIVRAHDAADIDAHLAAADAAGNFEIFHGAATIETSKKADISRRSVVTSRSGIVGPVDDMDVLDGVAVAVKGASEGYRIHSGGFVGPDWYP